jgi:hypothetical protein
MQLYQFRRYGSTPTIKSSLLHSSCAGRHLSKSWSATNFSASRSSAQLGKDRLLRSSRPAQWRFCASRLVADRGSWVGTASDLGPERQLDEAGIVRRQRVLGWQAPLCPHRGLVGGCDRRNSFNNAPAGQWRHRAGPASSGQVDACDRENHSRERSQHILSVRSRREASPARFRFPGLPKIQLVEFVPSGGRPGSRRAHQL